MLDRGSLVQKHGGSKWEADAGNARSCRSSPTADVSSFGITIITTSIGDYYGNVLDKALVLVLFTTLICMQLIFSYIVIYSCIQSRPLVAASVIVREQMIDTLHSKPVCPCTVLPFV